MKYYKLKNGSFVDLEENADIEFIEKLMTGMNINYKDLEKGNVKLPVNRSLYLNQLLKTVSNTQITKNKQTLETYLIVLISNSTPLGTSK